MRAPVRVLASCLAIGSVLVASCSEGGSSGDGAGGGGGDPASCEQPPTQGLSAPCCPAHGVDACGANLFCAAFDGRKQATCYAEYSRLDGQECTGERQCTSFSCNVQKRACRAMPGFECDPAIGCAPAPSGDRFACAPGSEQCEPIGSGGAGELCEVDGDCDLGLVCTSAACTEGCRDDAQCASGSCNVAEGACRAGPGEDCDLDVGCAPAGGKRNVCSRGSCVPVGTGEIGQPCETEADCDGELECWSHICVTGQRLCPGVTSEPGPCALADEQGCEDCRWNNSYYCDEACPQAYERAGRCANLHQCETMDCIIENCRSQHCAYMECAQVSCPVYEACE